MAGTGNPAGKQFKDFAEFMAERKPTKPFFFWLGSVHTALHQWKAGSREHGEVDPAKVRVPAYLPDTIRGARGDAAYLAAVGEDGRGVWRGRCAA